MTIENGPIRRDKTNRSKFGLALAEIINSTRHTDRLLIGVEASVRSSQRAGGRGLILFWQTDWRCAHDAAN